jgi:hypothetical protein
MSLGFSPCWSAVTTRKKSPQNLGTCWKTFFEKSDAKGAKAVWLWSVRTRYLDLRFWDIGVTSAPYPFPSQMAKVELYEVG